MNNAKLIQSLENKITMSDLSRIQKIKNAKILFSKILECAALLFRISFNVKIETFWGDRMTVVIPETVSLRLYRHGFFEGGLSYIILKHLKNGMVFFDVGAHFGYYTLLASYVVGAEGRVCSFEPTPSTFNVLKENAREKKNVFVNNIAVFSGKKEITINDYGVRRSAFNSIYEAGLAKNIIAKLRPKKYDIKTISIDEYIEGSKITPDFIKIDAERAEYEILLGMVKTIERFHPIITVEVGDCEVGCEHSSKDLVKFLTGKGYDVYEFKQGEIIPHTPQNSYLYGNLLFLPR